MNRPFLILGTRQKGHLAGEEITSFCASAMGETSGRKLFCAFGARELFVFDNIFFDLEFVTTLVTQAVMSAVSDLA